MKYQTVLFFGAPGSGKGTQGKILGQVPGYYHCACGDVFRGLDLRSKVGKMFLEYSSRGELVPDEFTVQLWKEAIDGLVTTRRLDPERETLVLDGIPRNIHQATMMADLIEVRKLFHLICPDRDKLVERLKRRALRDNRLDDANEDVIRHRLELYEDESRPVLEYYGNGCTVTVDATQMPLQVLTEILKALG